jgi:hypothetical protein
LIVSLLQVFCPQFYTICFIILVTCIDSASFSVHLDPAVVPLLDDIQHVPQIDLIQGRIVLRGILLSVAQKEDDRGINSNCPKNLKVPFLEVVLITVFTGYFY